ncbi:MAG: hypothetical protein SCK70_08305 [bacterium]|nr:hypothetical protein [bacterium]
MAAVRDHDPGKMLSGPEVSLLSCRLVFAKEKARRESCVIDLREYNNQSLEKM